MPAIVDREPGGIAPFDLDFQAFARHARPADQHILEGQARQLPRLRRSERQVDHAGTGQNGPPGDDVIGEEAVLRLIYRPVDVTGSVERCARALLVGLEHGSRTAAAPGLPAPWLRAGSAAPPGNFAGGFPEWQKSTGSGETTATGGQAAG